MDDVILMFAILYRELLLFAAIGFLIGGLDDMLIDLLWLRFRCWRTLTSATGEAEGASAQSPKGGDRLALFVPAWDEAGVIGPMLRATVAACRGQPCHIFVGCYRNDPATIAEARSVDDDGITVVICPRDGPTTKADCLNGLWHALQRETRETGRLFRAIILHDAEDLVSPCELPVMAGLLGSAGFVQLPVIPIVDPDSRWISGHYCDEFADAHGRTLPVRQAIGAAIPSAGVGCAIDVALLAERAAANEGGPFDVDSLTEDYELGLRLHDRGHATCFARVSTGGHAGLIATRAHFPATLEAAVRQKSRWIHGIALAGWERLGWSSSWRENWMRLRDRRTLLAALLLLSAYLAIAIGLGLAALQWWFGRELNLATMVAPWLIIANGVLLTWRLVVRAAFVTRRYGWLEGMRSIPRAVIGNIVTILAVRRAVHSYLRCRFGQPPVWDKTSHKFPHGVPS